MPEEEITKEGRLRRLAEDVEIFDGDRSIPEAIKVLYELLCAVASMKPMTHGTYVVSFHTQIAVRMIAFSAIADAFKITAEHSPQLTDPYERAWMTLMDNLNALEKSFHGDPNPEFYEAKKLALSCFAWT